MPFMTAVQTLVMTSATLTVADSFAYFCSRIGLNPPKPGGKNNWH
jgi:Rad3-related DNA helicase